MSDNLNKVIDGKFTIVQQIGKGSFGTIYLVQNFDNEMFAAKIEDAKMKSQQLAHEIKTLNLLQNGIGIPALLWHGRLDKNHVMVTELLGPNLEELFNLCNRKFSLKTVIMLADQMIQRIEYLHSQNILHRDIKPDNFVMGLGRKSILLHVLDFGLAKRYRDNRLQGHIPYRENKSLIGTARYSSINSHLGIEQSRRDDLEAIGYMLVYLLKGSLPWQGFKFQSRLEKYHKIMEKKMNTPASVLCKSLPIEIAAFIEYCRSLGFYDKPDYNYLKTLLKEIFLQNGYSWDYMYDWCLPIDGERQKLYQGNDTSIKTNIVDYYSQECKGIHLVGTEIIQQYSRKQNTHTQQKRSTYLSPDPQAGSYSNSQSKLKSQITSGLDVIIPNESKKGTILKQTSIQINMNLIRTLYEKVGGAPAIEIAVQRLYEQLVKDKRVMHFFKNTDIKRQVQRQKEFLTTVLGGPPIYMGRNMRDAHLNMGLQDEHFDVVVNTLGGILIELGVENQVVQDIAAVCETLRNDIVGT